MINDHKFGDLNDIDGRYRSLPGRAWLSWVLCSGSPGLQGRWWPGRGSHLRLRILFEACVFVGRIHFLTTCFFKTSRIFCDLSQFSHSVTSDSANPWTITLQASLSITNSQSLLKHRSIKSVMPSNHLILCHPLLLPLSIFPMIRVFSSESVLCIRWPKYSVPMNIQDWLPLGLTGLISLQAKGLSRVSDLRESLSLLLKRSPA